MRQFYSTKSITPEIREKIPNGFREFDVCENCGFDAKNCIDEDSWKAVVFRKRYNMALCDECTDKKDGTWGMQICEEDGRVKTYYPMRGETFSTGKRG